jgi:hypothetical protein
MVLLYSCANDKNGSEKVISKLVETTEDGTKVTTIFTYNGKELVTTDNSKVHADYTTSNGLVTKIVTTEKGNQSKVNVEYTYEKGKLVSLKSSEGLVVNFTHESDKSVLYQGFLIDGTEKRTKKYHGVLSFANGNLIKDSRIADTTPVDVISKEEVSHEYDSKKNPFHNVTGFDKILLQYELFSLNNSLISVVENSTTNTKDDQVMSSAKFHKRVFKYDEDGYPTEQITENAPGNKGYLKTEYFYQ